MIMAYHRVRGLVYQGTRSDYESIYKRVRKYNKKQIVDIRDGGVNLVVVMVESQLDQVIESVLQGGGLINYDQIVVNQVIMDQFIKQLQIRLEQMEVDQVQRVIDQNRVQQVDRLVQEMVEVGGQLIIGGDYQVLYLILCSRGCIIKTHLSEVHQIIRYRRWRDLFIMWQGQMKIGSQIMQSRSSRGRGYRGSVYGEGIEVRWTRC